MKRIIIALIPALSLLALAFPVSAGESPPDLTKGTSSIDRTRTYNLGATGLRGWIYTLPVKQFDLERMQGRTTLPAPVSYTHLTLPTIYSV